jgi:hypothetical protein
MSRLLRKMEKEKKKDTSLKIQERKRFWECITDQKSEHQNGCAPIKSQRGGAWKEDPSRKLRIKNQPMREFRQVKRAHSLARIVFIKD